MAPDAENDEVVMTLVAAALEQAPSERQAYLRSACRDSDALFETTWQRVRWEERMGSFLLEPLIPRRDLDRPFHPGDVLSERFRVIREVAHGGMGVVYQALDQRLNRQIAIKCARSGYGGRLPPEARNAREISHRNVCKLHDIHTCGTEHGEIDFLSMEFLEGETLSERIRRDGPLPEDEVRDIARQILAGLDAAHAKGVVHGDLKSNNVILTKESGGTLRAVITDFGLARPVESPGGAEPGVGSSALGGTLEYMAPELLKGQRASIAADLYAFGVILHEMVVGSRPESPGKMAPGLPRHWKRVISRCLQPEPARRFAGAQQALDSTDSHPWRWAAAALLLPFLLLLPPVQHKVEAWFAPPPMRLAVLPFDTDAETTSLASGILHDVSDRLVSAGKNFLLIPLTEAKRNGVQRIEQAKSVTNATHVLQGEMHRRDGTLTVFAAVIEVDSRQKVTQLTAEYRPKELALAAKAIAGSVAAGLHLRAPRHVETVAQLAYEPYVQGVYYLRRDSQSADSAIPFFEKAMQLDPGSALPYAGLAESQLQNYKRKKGSQWLDWAEASVSKAEGRNPDAVTVRLVAGQLKQTRGSYDAAAEDFRRAIELDPKSGEGYRQLGNVYESMNRPADALATFRKGIEVEPSYHRPYLDLASFYINQGRYREAEAEYRTVIQLVPDLAAGHNGLGTVLMLMGQYAEAEAEYRTALRLREVPLYLNNLGVLLTQLQRHAEAAPLFEKGIEKGAPTNILYINLADSYRRLQRFGQAEAAYRKGLEKVEHDLLEDPQDGYVRSIVAYACARLGDVKRAEMEIAQALKFSPGNARVFRSAVFTYETLNERDKTLEILASAAPDLLSELNRHPDLAGLRRDSRFIGLLTRNAVH